jgi:hypothetical protein
MRADVACALAAALFCAVAARALLDAGTPPWAAPLRALGWWFVLEFAIRTIVAEVRRALGR